MVLDLLTGWHVVQTGNFVFCHRMRNSNVNTEAFMRSGNLPVRYEVTNEGAYSR